MKKTIFTFLVMLISLGSFAQIGKGTMLVGGSFGLSFTTDKTKNDNVTVTNYKESSFSLAPDFGYFVIDNFAVGGSLNLSTTTYKYESNAEPKETITQVALAPFARYYYKNFFGEGQFGFGTGTYKTGNNKTTFNTTQWSLAAGYAAFLNDHVAIEPKIGYGSTITKNKDSDVKTLTPGLFVRVGFQIYLR
jgi:outer membrane protein